MKKIAGVAAAFVLIASGCSDKENPVIELNSRYLENVYGPVPAFTLLAEPKKNVLVEEFTGHKCGYCPPATAMMKAWDLEFGERLVPVIIHAGTLAAVGAAPYERDFTNPDGNVYWGQVVGGFNPSARIDRNPDEETAWPKEAWRNLIEEQMAKAPKAALQMATSYVPEDNVVNIHVHTQFLTNTPDAYALVVVLTESKIISPQLDYSQTPSDILEYEHNHVLHDAITPADGLPLVTAPRSNDVFVRSYTYELNPLWNPEHCKIVAYLMNPATQEVINAVEKDVVE